MRRITKIINLLLKTEIEEVVDDAFNLVRINTSEAKASSTSTLQFFLRRAGGGGRKKN